MKIFTKEQSLNCPAQTVIRILIFGPEILPYNNKERNDYDRKESYDKS